MAVTSKVYGLALQSMLNKEIDFDTDTIKAMLCTATYVPNQDTHRYKSSVTNEVVGTGYTAGGVALTSKTVTYDTASNTVTIDAADPAWANATLTARYLVFYDDAPATDATKPLISYVDFGADVSSTAATFTYQIPSTGIATFTAA